MKVLTVLSVFILLQNENSVEGGFDYVAKNLWQTKVVPYLWFLKTKDKPKPVQAAPEVIKQPCETNGEKRIKPVPGNCEMIRTCSVITKTERDLTCPGFGSIDDLEYYRYYPKLRACYKAKVTEESRKGTRKPNCDGDQPGDEGFVLSPCQESPAPRRTINVPLLESCDHYINCDKGIPVIMSCNHPGDIVKLVFDRNINKCVEPSMVSGHQTCYEPGLF